MYDLFKGWVKDYKKDELSKLLDSIYKTRLIRIDIDGDEEAFNIFERTNARGMDLEVSDLLKNYLYQQNVPNLNDKWEEIANNADGTIIKMLKYFYVSKNGYVNKSDLYPRIKDLCKDVGGAENLVEELRQFSVFYNIARKEDNDARIREYFESKGCKTIATDKDKYVRVHLNLQALRSFKVSQTYPVIYAALNSLIQNGGLVSVGLSKAFLKLLDTMEKYHFINNAICDRVGNEVEKLYAGFCATFAKTKDFEKTTNELTLKLRGQLASEDEFSTRFCEISYTRDTIPLIAYIFDRFNNFGVAPGERVPIFDPQKGLIRTSHNVEHFLPQKAGSDASAETATSEVLDNIGNLLVISFRANSSLGNLTPSKKMQKLKGDLAKKVQHLEYVKEFIEKYGDKAESWGDAAIMNRARDMAKDAYQRVWKLP